MKIENLLTAQRLAKQLKELDEALAELGKTDKFIKNSPGWGVPDENGLYQLHVTQYKDGSGFNVDMTGLDVGVQLLKYAKQLLEAKRSDILREIADL
jgi:hypothetical protein